MKRRALIFGIDGGTFNVVEPLLAAGRLPNLARMRDEGAMGTLASVCPPLTAPAWATFQTGLNPGRHGVFDFLAPPRLGYARRLQNASALTAPRFLDTLSAAGRTVGSVNMPLTFPPRPVSGFVIPGMLTPAVDRRYFYPPEVVDEIARHGDYAIDINSSFFEEGRDEEFLSDLRRVSEARLGISAGLLRERRPDLFVVVFTGVDRLMHFFWEQPELIREHYVWLDAALGELSAVAGEEAAVLVVSDHGFGPVTGEVNLAAHLVKHGFMALKRKKGPSPRGVMDLVAKLDLFGLRKKLPGRWRAAARGQVMERLSVFAAVDWERTRAFPGTSTQYGVYLNVAGREPEGVVARADYDAVREDLIATFDDLHPGLSGRILRREEVYFGPAVDDAPDVYLPLWENGVRIKEFSDDPAVAPRRPRPGEHRREGIFFARGPGVRDASFPHDAGIADVYPTLMYLMGECVPENLDGRVLEEIIDPGQWAAAPPTYRDYGSGNAESYADDEDAEVRTRLESMGYLG